MELEGLQAPTPRSRLDVERLDVYDRRGDGHTLARHCGVPPEELAERFREHPALPATGSFPDAATAQRCVEACVGAHRHLVALWESGQRPRLALEHDMGETVGDVLTQRALRSAHPQPQPATAVRVVLRRNPAYASGFAVLTAYPVVAPTTTYPDAP